jgi:N,N'-diacetyllegionaminate synthase
VKTLVIAEAGVNHNGDIRIAKKLIEAAANAGADIVKFQSFKANQMSTRLASKAKYQILAENKVESQYEMLERLELTEQAHHEIIAHCQSQEIEFLSTGFDKQSIDLLIKLGQEIFKIPSGEITNLPFLRHLGQLGKRLILSTGMANNDEIGSALKVLEESGTSREKITVLHCTSSYPAPLEDVNLSAMIEIKNRFEVNIGYSDHTNGIEIAIAAAALGATMIEKHFTIDRTLPGPDHMSSLEPDELKSMVDGIRKIELAIGDGRKRLMQSEVENREIVRKSIVSKIPIYFGESFSEANLTTKRPGSGVSPMKWDSLIGKKAQRDYLADELIDET